METIYKLYNMYFTKCTRAEYNAAVKKTNTQYIVKEENGDISLYLGEKPLISENDYVDADKKKVNFLPDADSQDDFNQEFQSDWNETDQNSLAYIKNKPSFSDGGISISGDISSDNSNIEFNSSDYTTTDLTNIDSYIGQDVTEDTKKYDFYLDGVIDLDDKDVLQKLVNGTWKKVTSTVTTKIASNGKDKYISHTQLNFVPTKLYMYNTSTNAWVASDNTDNKSFIYFVHENNMHKLKISNINYKYLYAYDYGQTDINRINDIINGIGNAATESEFVKYDINMDGVIDSTDLDYVKKFIPSITSDYWSSIYVTRSYIFGQDKYNTPNNTKSQDSNIISTNAVLYYIDSNNTEYNETNKIVLDNETILDVKNLNTSNINAQESITSQSGNIKSLSATNITATSASINEVNTDKLDMPNSDSELADVSIIKVDSTGKAITNLIDLDNDSIPTSFAVKDFVSNFPINQVQSNWNEADEDSPAYIENKPNMEDYTNIGDFNSLVTSVDKAINYSAFTGTAGSPLKIGSELSFDSTATHSALIFGTVIYNIGEVSYSSDFGCVCGIHYREEDNKIICRRIQGMIATSDATSTSSGETFISGPLDIVINLGDNSDGINPKVLSINFKAFVNGAAATSQSVHIYNVLGIG